MTQDDYLTLFDGTRYDDVGRCEVCDRYWRYCACPTDEPPKPWCRFQTVVPDPRYL